MTKKGQTVCVLDEHNAVIGHTYPNRAKGLVKKRRAEFVSDESIRLYKQCPTYENMEDTEMDQGNYITINPKEWCKNPGESHRTDLARFMINNPLADAMPSAEKLTEVLSIGSWDWNRYSFVTNGFLTLDPEMEYHFVFWLNGGENDRADEVCQLQILFTDYNVTASAKEFEEGFCYRLNRGYIKPLKKYKGWEYYDILFTTSKARYTQFQFVAHRAPMALMRAEEPDAYKDLENVTDPFEDRRPQRHNIYFEDGWPSDNRWYSTTNLSRAQEQGENQTPPNGSFTGDLPPMFFGKDLKPFNESFTGINVDDLRQEIVDSIMDELNLDDLREELIDSIVNDFDVDALREQILASVRDAVSHPSE